MSEKPLLSLEVPEQHKPISINHLIKNSGISQAMRRRLRHEGQFEVNGESVAWNFLLHGQDKLLVYFQASQEIEPWNFPLEIIYEDEFLLVINKPANLLMHPTSTERNHTLANAVVNYYEKSGQVATATFHPIHRLDKNTSGLVVIAKNAVVQHAFTHKRIKYHKIYEGLVQGYFPTAEGSIKWPVGRKEGSIIERCTTSKGKPAHTDLTGIKSGLNYSLVRFYLHTGRTHQIRVHSSHLGYPLLGDDLYGGNTTYINRQALHAKGLTFIHPMTDKKLILEAPFPEDMQLLVNKL